MLGYLVFFPPRKQFFKKMGASKPKLALNLLISLDF